MLLIEEVIPNSERRNEDGAGRRVRVWRVFCFGSAVPVCRDEHVGPWAWTPGSETVFQLFDRDRVDETERVVRHVLFRADSHVAMCAHSWKSYLGHAVVQRAEWASGGSCDFARERVDASVAVSARRREAPCA